VSALSLADWAWETLFARAVLQSNIHGTTDARGKSVKLCAIILKACSKTASPELYPLPERRHQRFDENLDCQKWCLIASGKFILDQTKQIQQSRH
jgi:hypothetical protein